MRLDTRSRYPEEIGEPMNATPLVHDLGQSIWVGNNAFTFIGGFRLWEEKEAVRS